MNKETTLDARHQSIDTISAFTENGDIEQRKPALKQAEIAGEVLAGVLADRK